MPGISAETASPVFAQGTSQSAQGVAELPSDTPPGLSFSDGQSSVPASSASSDPSISSFRSTSARSSVSAPAYLPIPLSPDPVPMRLSLPVDAEKKRMASILMAGEFVSKEPESMLKEPVPTEVPSELGVTPPMFSILIVSEQPYSRIAIAHHIKITLPKNIPNRITTVSKYSECKDYISNDGPAVFTHIVVNLPDHTEVIPLINQILSSPAHSLTTMLILTNPTQRTAVMQGAAQDCDQMGPRLQFIYKPIKPSRFGVVFDPANERDASMDRNRDSAHQVVETQKRVFSQMEREVGNRGHRVLLVEDNRVNQKVLLRFLARVGLEVETASDGEECVEKVFSHRPGYYGLILVCSLLLGYCWLDILMWVGTVRSSHAAKRRIPSYDRNSAVGAGAQGTKCADSRSFSQRDVRRCGPLHCRRILEICVQAC